VNRIVLAGVAAIALTAGCSQTAVSVVDGAAGTDVAMAQGGAPGTTAGPEGWPAGLPKDLPLPPEATLSGSLGEGGTVLALSYDWPGLTPQAYEEYAAALEDAGYILDGEVEAVELDDSGFSGGGVFSDGSVQVSVAAVSEDGAGQLTITIMPAMQ